MISTKAFGDELKSLGFDFYSGVPCSFLKNLINFAINECDYVAATNEGEAVAIAAGAYLGGKKPVVLMQNSGLTNAVSPLVSLNYPFRLPVLGFVSLRGEIGIPDEPQHELMGCITNGMLELMEIKWDYLSADLETAKEQLDRANSYIENNQSFFFIVKKNTFEKEGLKEQNLLINENRLKINQTIENEFPTRYETLQLINSLKDGKTVQLATTGKTGRELNEVEDVPNNFYMVGSMGCVSSIGLGLALTKNEHDLVVIEGDGALLMRMGSLATNGSYAPKNMLHILLDNNTHDSTGGQLTVSNNVQFVDIAAACGYSKSIYIHNLSELETSIKTWKKEKQLTFLYIKIAKGSKVDLGRPKMKPHEVKERLKVFIDD
ncbi:phosphonopyruvate decarboxylase [Neobacillus niacini]|uniref:phosphonopyruvate decarboxylase n=1 Tax=Neobacillus niacini TaxID=86668 RepID=UPI0005F054A5|nr:phosphonopyruvate decarboxylase [Neobacillus niacini]